MDYKIKSNQVTVYVYTFEIHEIKLSCLWFVLRNRLNIIPGKINDSTVVGQKIL